MSDKEETRNEAGEISRREFFKDAGLILGGAAISSTALIAAAPAPQTTTTPPAPTPAPTATPVPKAAWEIPPAPIADKDIKTTLSADIVVVGAGAAGLFAALAAAKSGAKVIEIEKEATLQGRGGDNTAIDSKIQKKLGVQIDKDRVVRELMKWGGGRLDARLLYMWANNSGKVMDLIIDMMEAEGKPTYLVIPDRTDEETLVIDKWPVPTGAPANWNYLDNTVVEYPTCHRPGKKGTGQAEWLKVVEKNILKAGGEIRYKTKAKQLVRDGDKGKITGVIAQDADGNYVRLNASKGVILCTGDYGANKEMLAKYNSLLPNMVPTSMGEGHQMAMWIGAVMENLPHCPMSHTWHALGPTGFLQVNKNAMRFYNEDVDTESMANQSFEQGGFWVVFDDSWTEDILKMGLGFFHPTSASATVKAELAKKVDAGTILKANTIEELAGKMKVPVDTFKATVTRYNELCTGGKDLDFGKRPDRLTAVDKAPFYASWTNKPAAALVILGGLLANDKLQALDAGGNVIPGLYLAGNTLGRRFKGGYPVICPGLSHSMAWTHGYLAGQLAATGAIKL